ncbi:hypothetical protein L226DRAFT_472711 [Lentinus tigrinus ALCF2SS1-7]|uniref:uncharacterized protein n=1 Tax=Lentinus tigrinus ALCF2SS1-7 TaxID=1328758 RepID=UPI001166263C|nr:hypothetical protein L226DRAFT_472711 [Lentinus tigrinus ALCF2SS1-7]
MSTHKSFLRLHICTDWHAYSHVSSLPHTNLDSDVAMTDASTSDLEPLSIPAYPFHIRLP